MNAIKTNLLHLSKRSNLNLISHSKFFKVKIIRWCFWVKISRFSFLSEFLSSVQIQEKRSELFSLEQERQKQNVGRIEKIEVRYLGQPKDTTLVMNKGLSTPFNCAQRMCDLEFIFLIFNLLEISWNRHKSNSLQPVSIGFSRQSHSLGYAQTTGRIMHVTIIAFHSDRSAFS